MVLINHARTRINIAQDQQIISLKLILSSLMAMRILWSYKDIIQILRHVCLEKDIAISLDTWDMIPKPVLLSLDATLKRIWNWPSILNTALNPICLYWRKVEILSLLKVLLRYVFVYSTWSIYVICTLFSNKRFLLTLIFWSNTSKFVMFYL